MNIDKLIDELDERRRQLIQDSINYTRRGSIEAAVGSQEASDALEEAIAIVRKHAEESKE